MATTTSKALQFPMKRRRFLTHSALALGALSGADTLLAACGGSSSTSSGGTTTISIMFDPNDIPAGTLETFMQLNPTIKVKLLAYDPIKLASSLAAGNPPDVVESPGIPTTPNFAARGLMTNLDPYFAKSTVLKVDDLAPINDGWRFDTSTLKQGTGPRYGMTKDWSFDYMLWFDERLFAKAGVAVPSTTTPLTYDQLLELGKELTVRQGGKIQIYGLNWTLALAPVLQMIAQQGGELFNSDLTKVDFTTPEARKALQWYYNEGMARVCNGPLDASSDWEWPLMQAKRMSIAQLGYWYGGEIITATDDLPDHVALAPAPLMGPTRISTCGAAVGGWIPQNSRNKDAAWKFMEYFFGGKPAQDRAKSGFGYPALKSLQALQPQGKPFQKEAFEVSQSEAAYFKVLKYSPYASADAINSALTTNMTAALQNRMSFDAMLTQLTQSVNLLLQQGKEQIG